MNQLITDLKVAVVMINWNGEEDSLNCIAALRSQTAPHALILVDNGSSDDLGQTLKKTHPNLLYKESPCTVDDVVLLENHKNLGFAGGANTGIRHAIKNNFDYVALINNDATPAKTWVEELLKSASEDSKIGITTGKLLKTDGEIDSTGDQYTIWGLPYPRGRNDEDNGQYESAEFVFAGSGGASLYSIKMLKQIGLFDEDFFAYYEDVDISFRAQLAGWKVMYEPKAVAHHKIGATSGSLPGFTTYQTIKNLPWLLWKNVPLGLLPKILPKFFISYNAIVFSSLSKGKFGPVLKGLLITTFLLPKKLVQRHKIQRSKVVSTSYIDKKLTHDLPPNAHKLRKLRSLFTKTP